MRMAMPIYTLQNVDTQETWDVHCSYKQLQKMLKDPKIEHVFKAPNIIGSRDGSVRVPDGFKDLKKRMKKQAGSGNTIR